MLDERQLKAIERLVDGSFTIKDIAEEAGVSRKTIYAWMKKDNFKQMLHEATELKNSVLREKVKGTVEQNIRTLEKLRDTSKNDMTRYHCANLLLQYAGWKDNAQEIIIKSNDAEEKNHLLSLLGKDNDNESNDKEEEQLH